MMSMSLEDKVFQTCENIAIWDLFTDGQWYISFSGGKDSTVLLYISAKMANNMVSPRPLHVLFCDTGLEYPEIRKFVPWYVNWIQERFPRVVIDLDVRRPKKHFMDVIRDKGYPVISKEVSFDVQKARNGSKISLSKLKGEYFLKDGRLSPYNLPKWEFLLRLPILISSQCCHYTKKEPSKTFGKEARKAPIIASMAVESKLRYQKWIESGCNAFEGMHPQSKPMSFWTDQDVLAYKIQEDIPFCSVYGDVLAFDGENYYDKTLSDCRLKCTGCQRTGCTFCAFGAHLEKGDDRRFVRLKQTHPKHWNFAINGGEWDPVDGMWKPSKTPGHIGLGMGRVLDYIGVPYE